MKKVAIYVFTFVLLFSCASDQNEIINEKEADTYSIMNWVENNKMDINPALPTIGLLMYEDVLQSEVIATSDVFSKPDSQGKKLFNVITIAPNHNPIRTEEGMVFVPDFSIDDCPELTAMFVPSSFNMESVVSNKELIKFIQERNEETIYTVSNCAGAQLIGASGIADGHKIVTWIGGGGQLQIDYPNLLVQDDAEVTYIEDGKFSSSNGNLASYISALEVLEKMTSKEHRKSVEDRLYIDRLKDLDR